MYRMHDGEYCAECGAVATDTHHCIFGKNRQNSETWGLTVRLCRSCHRRLHDSDEQLAMRYRKAAQMAFTLAYGHDEYMKIFGRNYL